MRLAFIVLFLLLGINSFAETINDQNLITLSDLQKKSYGISVAKLEPAPETFGASYPGQVVVPNSQIQVISARQAGLVETLLVAEGDHVSKGQILTKIQSPALLKLQQELLQTLIQLNLARSTLNRNKQLMEEGITPKRLYQESLSNWQTLQTQKEQQEAILQYSGMSAEAIANLEKTRKLNSALEITAPFDGVLLDQMVIPGQKLAAADPLFKIGQLSPLWIEIHVPIDSVKNVSKGNLIIIPDLDIRGEIITIGSKIHSADQGTLVRAIVKDNVEQLRPGQFIQARLSQSAMAKQHYLVPDKSIIRLDKKTLIFVETEQGYSAVNINVIGNREGQQIIASEHAITDPVVVNGAITLKAILTGAGSEN